MAPKPKRYKLRYLPLFWEDLSQAASYIAFDLKNPAAAERLVDSVEVGILDHLKNPTMAPVYHTTRNRPVPYYWFAVGNYSGSAPLSLSRARYRIIDSLMLRPEWGNWTFFFTGGRLLRASALISDTAMGDNGGLTN